MTANRRPTPVDLSLYFILGPDHWGERDPAWLVREAVAGGATLVQLRAKQTGTREMIEMARALKRALAGTGVPLLINDRADVALAAEADGVHVGRDDIAPADARRLLGPDAVVGVTVKTPAEADAVDPRVVDYASVGGIFTTLSKRNPDPPIGLAGLRDRVARIRGVAPGLPISAIAGVNATNAETVVRAGADGVALVSAVAAAADPRAAAWSLAVAVAAAKATRAAPSPPKQEEVDP
ncbi:MAG: thiamine phosphate synthase [Marivibrio sp.]|uniref:thiamine phosphate synthase n=1 Tax=Marivibrio sp. TaxID=2039719 RepID=UPI0032EE39D7